MRNGTAKLLTLFHPRDGHLRVKGVRRCSNEVLLSWLQGELAAIVTKLPSAPELPPAERRALWERWQEGLQVRITLPAEPPPLRLLLILDNLVGHKNPDFVRWCFLCAAAGLPTCCPCGRGLSELWPEPGSDHRLHPHPPGPGHLSRATRPSV